ncbi:hypothetical protein [uncultured Actinomyces sp.]|uniref:hypothetical protein n=1 Tax=uncultured Actinomyces sp. TaxID=249061 RepID=UPI0028DD38A2|nr:hypothetical protein [uncultured Actinomyces sp.]
MARATVSSTAAGSGTVRGAVGRPSGTAHRPSARGTAISPRSPAGNESVTE